MPPRPRPIAERFWEKVAVGGPDDCWEWQASRDKRGYGKFAVTRSQWVPASRMAYELTAGPIPAGLHVLHSCDNPPCCNPRHLHLGTGADNTREASARGLLKGPGLAERHPRGRLTDEDVRVLRAAVGNGASLAEVASEFGIKVESARDVATGRKRRRAGGLGGQETAA